MQQPSKATATELFEGRKHYVIPAYQRPYVWNEEDQWAPLWDDVIRLSESHLISSESQVVSHFLGAVVFEVTKAGSAAMTELDVIDGQQRLTTLQLLLDAVEGVLDNLDYADDAERLNELILNKQSTYRGTPHRFKLRPSQANSAEFEHAMDPAAPQPAESGQIQAAHDFFKAEALKWLLGEPDADGNTPPGTQDDRARELAETLAGRLVVVAIDLTGDDDAQLIFETLNDRGTPLLKADLIKNWVFRLGRRIGADVDSWARTVWEDFDTDWWREEITQGRLSRSRVDIFLHYWLIMSRQEEVKSEQVFHAFRNFAEPQMRTPHDADEFLKKLRIDANTFRNFGELRDDTTEGQFRSRVIETMELAATTPVFLWTISPNRNVPVNQIEIGLSALESWVVRRTLLQMTTKDVNKLIVALLRVLAETSPENVGERIRQFLSDQTSPTRAWPTDQSIIDEISSKRMYGYIKQNRIAVVLRAIEELKRSEDPKYGDVPMPTSLTIEHVMPQKWREHWGNGTDLSPEDEQFRDRAVQTLGNLTLTPQSLNSSLSNRPWTDGEANGLESGGLPGQGKWSILSQFNLQVLNKEILERRDSWTEADIVSRSEDLSRAIVKIWEGPSSPSESEEISRS